MLKKMLVLMAGLLLVASAYGQTVITDSAKVPAGCVQLSHCFTTSATNSQTLIWTNGMGFLLYNTNPSGGTGYTADNVTIYDLVQVPGSDRTQTYPFTLHTAGADDEDTFSIDMVLAGYRFYNRGSGGRGGGGAGWRYIITSWNVKVTVQ